MALHSSLFGPVVHTLTIVEPIWPIKATVAEISAHLKCIGGHVFLEPFLQSLVTFILC